MRRVLVIGPPGAGKSTFARRLADIVGLPLIPLDREYWQPGWVQPEPVAWRRRVAELAARDEWIMDGNYSGTFDLRIPRADTVLWLDFPRRRCIARVLKRTWADLGRTRPDMADGCPERFDLGFLQFCWRQPRTGRPRIAAAIRDLGPDVRWERFTTDRAAARFLKSAGAA